MPSPKYPLKPLLELRGRQVDEATVGLGEAIRARELAEKAQEEAIAQRRAADEAAERVRNEEAARLTGSCRVGDLAQLQAWEVAVTAKAEQLTARIAVARERVEDRHGEEAEARSVLAGSLADRDVVAKDEARFVDHWKKRVVATEEESAEEVFGARGSRGPGGRVG